MHLCHRLTGVVYPAFCNIVRNDTELNILDLHVLPEVDGATDYEIKGENYLRFGAPSLGLGLSTKILMIRSFLCNLGKGCR